MILINPYWETCPTSLTGASSTNGTSIGNLDLIPHKGLFDFTWSAWIMTSAEIGGAKQISALAYYPTSYTGGYQFFNQRIKMAHVQESAFPNDPVQINLSELTISDLKIVKDFFDENVINNVPNKRTFTSNFCYNGTDNLLIIWENYDGDWTNPGGGTHQQVNGPSQAAAKNQDTTFPSGTAGRLNTKPRTTLYY